MEHVHVSTVHGYDIQRKSDSELHVKKLDKI